MKNETEVLKSVKSFSGPLNDGSNLPAIGTTALQTKTTYNTAVSVRQPRDMARIRDNVLLEAQLAGSGFFYRWTVKNKKTGKVSVIEGPTVDLAMCLARNYGNAAIEVAMEETPTHYVFTAALIDLETGFTSPRLFKQRKMQGIGEKYGKERQEDIVFQIGQSKAIRNAIIRSMPGWLIDRAIQVAKDAELATIKPGQLADAREKMVSFFEGYGITRNQIEHKLGKTIEQMTAQDVLDMRGEARAIKDGHITARELFPPIDDNQGDMREPPSAPEPGRQEEGQKETPKPVFKCTFCGFEASSKGGLTRHINKCEKNPANAPDEVSDDEKEVDSSAVTVPDDTFNNINDDVAATVEASELMKYVKSDPLLLDVWNKTIKQHPIDDLDRIEAVKKYLDNAKAKHGSTLGSANSEIPTR